MKSTLFVKHISTKKQFKVPYSKKKKKNTVINYETAINIAFGQIALSK